MTGVVLILLAIAGLLTLSNWRLRKMALDFTAFNTQVSRLESTVNALVAKASAPPATDTAGQEVLDAATAKVKVLADAAQAALSPPVA